MTAVYVGGIEPNANFTIGGCAGMARSAVEYYEVFGMKLLPTLAKNS